MNGIIVLPFVTIVPLLMYVLIKRCYSFNKKVTKITLVLILILCIAWGVFNVIWGKGAIGGIIILIPTLTVVFLTPLWLFFILRRDFVGKLSTKSKNSL